MIEVIPCTRSFRSHSPKRRKYKNSGHIGLEKTMWKTEMDLEIGSITPELCRDQMHREQDHIFMEECH